VRPLLRQILKGLNVVLSKSFDSTRLIKFLVLLSVFLFWFSHYVYLPTLPQYVLLKTGTLTQVGIVLAMYGLWQAVVRLPIGIITDKIGHRKTFILAGIMLAGIGALVMGFSGAFLGLTFGRSLVGLSMGAWVLQVVFFGSLFRDEEMIKAGSILTLASSLAKMAGTFATGYLNSSGGYLTAFLVSATAAAFSLLVLLSVPDSSAHLNSSHPPFKIGLVFRNPKVRYVSLMAAVNQFLNFGLVFGFFPLIVQEMGANDIIKSYLLTVNIFCLIAGNVLVTSIGKSENSVRLLAVSYLLFAVGIIFTPFAGGVGLLFLLQALLGFAHGIGYPVLIGVCMEDIPDNGRASAMGFHQSVYAVGMFLGPWLCGILAERHGLDATFIVTGAAALLISYVLLFFLRHAVYQY